MSRDADGAAGGAGGGAQSGGNRSKIARTAQILRVLVRHVHIDWLKAARLDLPESIEPGDPESLASDLESLGPTFVKLGQLVSSRPDFVPRPYIDALSRLQQNVTPMDAETVEAIVEEQLGAATSALFESFDRTPLASASLGQVHRATLRDPAPVEVDDESPHETLRTVVVKVQRPGIREAIVQDLEILEQIARALDRVTEIARRVALPAVVDEMRSTLLRELDYRMEARSLDRLAEILEGYPRIRVPRPVAALSTSRVLTMDFVEGEKITSIGPLQRTEIDGAALADELFSAYLDQVLVHGFFHADPHPGNLLIGEDGRLALIDLGMVAELSRARRDQLIRLLLAIADDQADEAASVCIEIGDPEPDFDRRRFERGVTKLIKQARQSSVEDLEFGMLMISVVQLASDTGLRPAPELSMLAKTLLQLDQAALALDPEFEPMVALKRHARSIVGSHLLEGLAPEALVSAGLEVRELVQTLPKRVNAVLGALAGNRLEIRVDAFDEERFHGTLQRVANRLAVSVVLAALILGAALLIQIDTTFRIFGYPAIALFLFLLAAACGFYLVFDVFRSESRKRRRPRS